MSLSAGDKLGPYEIVAPIGAGGMGEVYKARDTRLDRTVAVKISQGNFSERFEREARAVAALNHSNICTLHDVGPNYLVMEYIEGTTLKGPLPVDQALKYAAQICDALDAAHKKGITHRDLKPANILVTKAGVKLLDFGLAKMGPAIQAGEGTMSMALTGKGEILGTFQYMSPEQVTGQDAGPRSDIFSFGLVLYEMLTGKRAFEGSSPASVIAAIIERPAPSIADVAPPALDRVLQKCLAKDPDNRWQSARDLKDELEWIISAPESGSAVPAAPTPRHRSWLPWCIAAFLLLVLMPANILQFRKTPPEQHSVRFQIPPPEKSAFREFRLSPDGRFLAFAASDGKLWVRALDSLRADPLSGNDGASNLFWSPDSQFIGFVAKRQLKKIAVSGGPAQVLADAPNARGGTWNRDGVILFAPTPGSGFFRVPAGGGAPVQVSKLGESSSSDTHRYPEFLPDGRHFLYAVFGNAARDGIWVGSLDGKPPMRLLPDISNVMYSPALSGASDHSGFLLFGRGDALMAQSFDPVQLRLVGDAFPVAEHVGPGRTLNQAAFSIAENGTLVYRTSTSTVFQLVWADRAGKQVGLFGPPGTYSRFRLAPDEKRIAFDVSYHDVWVMDAVRGVTSRLASTSDYNNLPMWSPDGQRILSASNRNGGYDVYSQLASGAGPTNLSIKMGTANGFPVDWSPDGRFVLYQMPGAKTGQDLWVAPQSPAGGEGSKPFPYLQSAFDEQDGRFSPDGNWVAYLSDESGRDEVYVQSFPDPGVKFQISSGGGAEPQWRKDGTELFYLAPDGNLMAVPVTLGRAGSKSFQAGLAKALLPIAMAGDQLYPRSYAVSNDGQRFLVPASASGTAPPLTVVLNWQAGVKK